MIVDGGYNGIQMEYKILTFGISLLAIVGLPPNFPELCLIVSVILIPNFGII